MGQALSLTRPGPPPVVVTRLTRWLTREAQRIQDWTEPDADYAALDCSLDCAAGQFHLRLHGWSTERRFVVIRERVRESGASAGRKLTEAPGYTFRIFVTSRPDGAGEIWRDYNRRADMENRTAKL